MAELKGREEAPAIPISIKQIKGFQTLLKQEFERDMHSGEFGSRAVLMAR